MAGILLAPSLARAQATYPFTSLGGDLRVHLLTTSVPYNQCDPDDPDYLDCVSEPTGLESGCNPALGNCFINTTSQLDPTADAAFTNVAIALADFWISDLAGNPERLHTLRVEVSILGYNASTAELTWRAEMDFLPDLGSGVSRDIIWNANIHAILWNGPTLAQGSPEVLQCTIPASGAASTTSCTTTDSEPTSTFLGAREFVTWLPQEIRVGVDIGDPLEVTELGFKIDRATASGANQVWGAECNLQGTAVNPTSRRCEFRVVPLTGLPGVFSVADETTLHSAYGNGVVAERYRPGPAAPGFIPIWTEGRLSLGSPSQVAGLQGGCLGARYDISAIEIANLDKNYDPPPCGTPTHICYDDAQSIVVDGYDHDFDPGTYHGFRTRFLIEPSGSPSVTGVTNCEKVFLP